MNAPRFSLRQLAYFVAIAEAGTISEAALRLHISQPAVSLALSDLERALHVQLCVRRKSHGITLTPSGHQVLRRARQLLRQADDLVGEASAGEGALTGVLSLGCYVTLAPTVLPPLLQGFSALHPQLSVDFTEDTQDVLQRRLLSGELDVAVIYDMDVLPEMARAELFAVRPHVLLPVDHPLAACPAVSLHELAEEPMILLDAAPSSHHALGLCHSFNVVPRVRYRPTSYEVARALVGRGLGYSILVQRPSNDRTYEGRQVVIKEIAEPVRAEAVLLAWPRAVRLNRRAEEFLRFCRSAARPPGARLAPTGAEAAGARARGQE